MKKLLFIFFVFISATSFAQFSTFSNSAGGSGVSSSANATVMASIVSPITIHSTSGLDFGPIAATSAGGVVEIDTEGLRTGPQEMLIPSGASTQAAFSVNAAKDYVYTIALGGGQLTLAGGEGGASNTMNVNYRHDRIADQGDNFRGTGEEEIINVGGKLEVQPNQSPGVYMGMVTMTVAYQ